MTDPAFTPEPDRLLKYIFDLYVGGITNKLPTQLSTLAYLAELLRSDRYEEPTHRLRSQSDKKARDKIKKSFDYVTPAGMFSPHREEKNLTAHSGLMVLDFDHVANLWETRLQLQADPHTLLLFVSPSGDGLKLLVAVDVPTDLLTDETRPGVLSRHREVFGDLSLYFQQTYNLLPDATGIDPSRAMFLCQAKDVFVQPTADVYQVRGLVKKKPPKPRTQAQQITDASELYRHVEAVVQRIEEAKVDITGGPGEYDVRLLVAFCMSTLGEAGRDLLHRVLYFYPNYTAEETDAKFEEGVHKSRFTTPWKFFDLAKAAGIDVSKPKREKVKGKSAVEQVPQVEITDPQSTGEKPAAVTDITKKKGIRSSNVDYRTDGGVWIWGTKNWICVAENFQFFVKYVTEDENEEKTWILEVVVADRDEPIYIEVTHEEFCSATKLKNKLAGHRLALKLTDTYLGELWQYLFAQQFPLAMKVSRLGYHAESGVFFFANKAVNGELLTPDEFGIVTTKTDGGKALSLSMPVVKKKRAHLFVLKDGEMRFNTWFNHLVAVHKYENAVIPACFYLMSLFRDLIVKHTAASPILYLKGGASSGKSSLVRSICRLFGLHEAVANLKNKNTEAGLVRVMGQVSNAVIWMDEYHNEFPFEGLLQSAYDDNGYIRAEENSTSGIDTVDIFSALALTSNYIPDNPIFFSRCVFVPIIDQSKTDEQRVAFAEFADIESGGLTSVTLELLAYRELIARNLRGAYNELYECLKEAVKGEKVVERLISNMARVLTPAYILQRLGKINLQLEVADAADVLEEFVAIGAKFILRQHQVQSEKTALSEFFEILQNGYEQGYLQEDVHYRIARSERGEVLLLRFPSLYTLYAQKYRQAFYKAPPDRDTLKSEIVAFEQPEDPDNFFKNIKFSPDADDDAHRPKTSVSGSCALTYSKVQDHFGIDWRGHRVSRTN